VELRQRRLKEAISFLSAGSRRLSSYTAPLSSMFLQTNIPESGKTPFPLDKAATRGYDKE
jgi:hypothetical protein